MSIVVDERVPAHLRDGLGRFHRYVDEFTFRLIGISTVYTDRCVKTDGLTRERIRKGGISKC